MSEERNQYSPGTMSLHDQCKKYLYYHAILTMNDGNSFDGIIENVGHGDITVLVGEDVLERDSEEESFDRQYYGGGYGYGRPRGRYRRFRRQTLPIATLAALALLPYAFAPYPQYPAYPPPYYPYY